MADLTSKGFDILTPVVSEHLPFDFVGYKDGKLFKFQAKYTSDGSLKSRTSWADKNGNHYSEYSGPRPNKRKVERPSKEELRKLIWSKPLTKLSRELGFSDVAISKWVKAYELDKPPHGYWIKIGFRLC